MGTLKFDPRIPETIGASIVVLTSSDYVISLNNHPQYITVRYAGLVGRRVKHYDYFISFITIDHQ